MGRRKKIKQEKRPRLGVNSLCARCEKECKQTNRVLVVHCPPCKLKDKKIKKKI